MPRRVWQWTAGVEVWEGSRRVGAAHPLNRPGRGEIQGMTVAHYRIYELDPADQIMDGYSVMCRSDAAALAMASNCAENRAAAVEVWESERHVARLDPMTPWHRLRRQWTGR
jgi:hypothetical protein